MKITVALLAACLNLVIADPKASSTYGLMGMEDALNSLNQVPNRAKRQSGDTETLACVTSCMAPIKNLTENLELTAYSLNPDLFFDQQKLTSFCNAVSQAHPCLNRCDLGADMREFIELAFGTFDYVCVDNRREFESYLGCYQQSEQRLRQVCDSRCGGDERMKTLHNNQQLSKLLKDIDGLANNLGDTCELISCSKGCENEVITEECRDSKPAALLRYCGIPQMKQLEDKFMMSAQLQEFWPQACTQLIDQNMPGRINGNSRTNSNGNSNRFTNGFDNNNNGGYNNNNNNQN